MDRKKSGIASFNYLEDYIKPISFIDERVITSVTASKTMLIFSESLAHVKWRYTSRSTWFCNANCCDINAAASSLPLESLQYVSKHFDKGE